MNRYITSAHNHLAHLIQAAFGRDWKTAFSWAARAADDESASWAERPDSVFGHWSLHAVSAVQRHMEALADGYALIGEPWRARTFRRFAALLRERVEADKGVDFSEVLALQGVGSGVLDEILNFYKCSTSESPRTPTPRARQLALTINERLREGRGERVWMMRVRDELMRPAYWRHLAAHGGGMTGEQF